MFFKKIQGLGNDYIYLNDLGGKLKNIDELAIKLCDRNMGIGANGLILLQQSLSNEADFKMRIFNPDGFEAEMCGNGIRGLGKYIYEENISKKNNLKIETKSGIKNLKLIIEDNKVESVIVDMGIVIVDTIKTLDIKEQCINKTIIVDDKVYKYTSICVGNPHCVIFINNLSDLSIKKIGPLIENHKFFPNRTNVEFVKIIDKNNIALKVWERGVGNTLACGTGAVASVAAGIIDNKIDNNCNVYLKKGILKIYYNNLNKHFYLNGPIEDVFEGNIKINRKKYKTN